MPLSCCSLMSLLYIFWWKVCQIVFYYIEIVYIYIYKTSREMWIESSFEYDLTNTPIPRLTSSGTKASVGGRRKLKFSSNWFLIRLCAPRLSGYKAPLTLILRSDDLRTLSSPRSSHLVCKRLAHTYKVKM